MQREWMTPNDTTPRGGEGRSGSRPEPLDLRKSILRAEMRRAACMPGVLHMFLRGKLAKHADMKLPDGE